ncbi:MAG TPA: hypothetical protein PKL57_14880 [Candidatus Wallbacteria bacterium]|nr:hypothetical protein [Candidatus Wallbacteria bacterium]
MREKFRYIAKLIIYASLIALPANFQALCIAADKNEQAQAAPAGEPFIATIDLATVYALHPMMNYYDPSLNLFIKPAPKGATHADFVALISERRKQYNKEAAAKAHELQKIKDDIETVWKEIKKSGTKKMTDFDLLEKKYAPLLQKTTNEVELKKNQLQYAEASREFYDKYDAEFKGKQKKLSSLLDAQEKIQFSLLRNYYLPPEETDKIFEQINADIKEAVKIAAKKNNVRAVLNFNMLNADFKNKSLQGVEAEKKLTSDETEALLKDGPDYSRPLETLKAYESFNDKTPGFNPRLFSSEFSPSGGLSARPLVTRGKDLTWFTVITLMVKNGIPKEKAEAVSDVISEIYKIDNE